MLSLIRVVPEAVAGGIALTVIVLAVLYIHWSGARITALNQQVAVAQARSATLAAENQSLTTQMQAIKAATDAANAQLESLRLAAARASRAVNAPAISADPSGIQAEVNAEEAALLATLQAIGTHASTNSPARAP